MGETVRNVPIPPKFYFQDAGIVPGVRVYIKFRGTPAWPAECSGVVKKIYPCFALVLTDGGYHVTIHITDIPARFALVEVTGRKMRGAGPVMTADIA